MAGQVGAGLLLVILLTPTPGHAAASASEACDEGDANPNAGGASNAAGDEHSDVGSVHSGDGVTHGRGEETSQIDWIDYDAADGGWGLPPDHHTVLDTGTLCNMRRVTAAEWPHMFRSLDQDEPVVITDYRANQHGRFRQICHRDELLRRYGSNTVTLSSANTHSYDKSKRPFSEYLEYTTTPIGLDNVAGETWYMFGDNDYATWTNFTKHYERPTFDYHREPFFSFGIGGSGSGVPFHTHGAVFAEVIHGRKRWFVARPDEQPNFNPHNTSLIWALGVYPSLEKDHPKVFDCTLGPGEVLYMGHGVWHSTLNIGSTVFISTFI